MGKVKKYKLKTHKSTSKRFRITAGGKVMGTKIGKSHRRHWSSKRVRAKFSRGQEVTNTANQKRVRALAPYLRRYRQNPTA
jgi:large subunit ribosomal protein L35